MRTGVPSRALPSPAPAAPSPTPPHTSQRTRGTLGHLDAGTYFGEMCMLSSKSFGARRFAMDRRTATITARTICDVNVLSQHDLENVISEFPSLLLQVP